MMNKGGTAEFFVLSNEDFFYWEGENMSLKTNYEFAKNEEDILKFWDENETFKKLLEKNKNGKKYRFIDGPITANNRMKLHHTWGRTLKDTFLRYKGMQGYTSHYRNGFDGQGLWVEVEVEKELGFKTKKDIENYGLDKFTDACVARVKKYASEITEQSKRLGQWMDWDNSYYTYTDENITSIWYFLKKCHEKGMIKETYKPMPWCARCGTSLSEHEMSGSYHDVTHKAVFFKLPVIGEEYKMLVWTTTPWTLSANVALAVNPEYDYVEVKFPNEDTPLVLCESVFESRFKKEGEVLRKFKGTELEGKEFETCFPELKLQEGVKHNIVLWDEVTSEDGSGVVHIAPGCGAEDFELGEKLGLSKLVPIDESGVMLESTGFLAGKNAKGVPELVFDELKKRNKLFLVHDIKHSYPYCWRCKEDILFRLVKEWAIDVDVVRDDLIRNAKSVKWYPEYQGKRMLDWLNNMGSWNISRRRFYGLPLPFYHCENCGELTVIGSKEELREKAVDKSIVDSLKELHRPWIDNVKIVCPCCGKEVSRVTQVGDVWLDAGIVPFSTLKYFTDRDYWKEYFPAEYVVEMHEQIRLWFYSLLFMSTVLENRAPYEAVGTYGMITAEDGTKFSKTGFNIDLEEAIDRLGIDPIRYLYASTNPVNDVRFGYSLGDEAKRKLMGYYNMAVFFDTYASIDKPDLTNYMPDIRDLNVSDKYLIKITDEFIKNATKNMEEYDCKDVCALFEKYVDDVSNFYIRINRRRFWKSENGIDKKNAFYSLFYALKTVTQVMAPIVPFITEYVWQNLLVCYDSNLPHSVHLSSYPKESDYVITDNIINITNYTRNIITIALKMRNENNIKVRQPLSKLYIQTKYDLSEYYPVIKSELNVKDLDIVDNFDNLKTGYLELNFKNAGGVLKQDVNKVKELLSNIDSSIYVEDIKEGKSIKIPGYDSELVNSIFNIKYTAKENICIHEDNDVMVALDTTITEDLKKEGILRDIIRSCQVYRKESGFNVDDRINICFETSDQYIKNIIDDNAKIIESELLAVISEDDYEISYNYDDSLVIKMKLLK